MSDEPRAERAERAERADVVVVPVADALTAPYWDGAALGELRLQRCRPCGATWHPPLPRCPRCRAADPPEWYAASGRGVVESATVVHQAAHPAFASRVPYAVVTVRLAEGPLVVANIVTGPDDPTPLAAAPAVGAAVRAVFCAIADGIAIPQFVAT